MNKNSAEATEPSRLLVGQGERNFHNLVSTIERSRIEVTDLSAAALSDVLAGVITGEGPTTGGRAHFSRSLDRNDALLCERILMAAGGEAGVPVTRAEADVLFDIDAAAAERSDGGRFGNLLVKSVAHCVLGEVGQKVPPRQVALAPATPLSTWASRADADVDSEILVWIASHVRNKKRVKSTLMGISAFLVGIGATLSVAGPSLITAVDLIA